MARLPVRTADENLLDTFLVCAIATLLLIRIALEATGYPRLGGNGLHVAHVLWGGLGMLLAIMLLLMFLSPVTRLFAAILGGAGFGAFVDELGKFLTADNNYFFKPTAALVYALFVLLYLATREVRRRSGLSPQESLANALELAEQLPDGRLTAGERARALELLSHADQTEPLVATLRDRFLSAPVDADRRIPFRATALKLGRWYAQAAETRWFHRAVAAIFILQAVAFVLSVTAALVMVTGAAVGIEDARSALTEAAGGSTLSSWIQLVATGLAGALLVWGIAALRRSRIRAYRAFELSILVDLLLAQPFAFLDVGFTAAVGVFIDLALLGTLRYLLELERGMVSEPKVRAAAVA